MFRLLHSAPISGKILGVVLLILLVLGLGGTILLQLEKQPEYSPVGRGAKLAETAGCFACHGRGEGEKRFNLRRKEDSWINKSNPTFWDGDITKVEEIVEWISNGVTADQVEKHKKLFIRMPAYKDRLKPAEIDAIAAWILAEGLKNTEGTGPMAKPADLPASLPLSADKLLVSGDRLSRKFGCYQCHGELGQGGVANPQSFKGYIPGFFGQDFLKLTAHGDRAEILHWIDHGRGRAVESGLLGRLAKSYLDRQAIPMPGYRDQLVPPEKELLADYLLLLNKSGALPAKEIERIATLLNTNASSQN
jgi:mono/diheme cytochrome c family protein